MLSIALLSDSRRLKFGQTDIENLRDLAEEKKCVVYSRLLLIVLLGWDSLLSNTYVIVPNLICKILPLSLVEYFIYIFVFFLYLQPRCFATVYFAWLSILQWWSHRQTWTVGYSVCLL